MTRPGHRFEVGRALLVCIASCVHVLSPVGGSGTGIPSSFCSVNGFGLEYEVNNFEIRVVVSTRIAYMCVSCSKEYTIQS
jgi:hypothetical protein